MTHLSQTRVYAACLAAYNNGILHGAWIDADQDADEIQAEIADMLKASPIPDAEEWAIHDYEGFYGMGVAEYEGSSTIADKAKFLGEQGALGAAVANYYGGDLEDARRAFEDAYFGEYRSVADFAEESTENQVDVPEHLRAYIDYERMGEDMQLSGDIVVFDQDFDGVHIFGGW